MIGFFNCTGAGDDGHIPICWRGGELGEGGRVVFKGYHLEVYPYRQKKDLVQKDNRCPQKIQFPATLHHGVPKLQSPDDYHSFFMPS